MRRRRGKRSVGHALWSGVGLAALITSGALADPPDYSGDLFGDLGGLRTAFAKVGVTVGATESSEVFANPTGGLKQGANYDGLTTVTLQMDTKAAFGLEGGQINASLLQLHGENYSVDNIGVLQTISGIQGDRATRLWELWWDQKFGDHFDVKFGQQSLDVEFAGAPSSGVFVNALFGWSALDALDLPGGGPAFPLSSLGVRGRWQSGPWTVLAGVFSGSPASNANADPQHANAYGVSFPWDGALAVAETQYAVGQGEGQYAGVYKIGAWYDSLPFADQQYNTLGQPLADPAADPTPRRRDGDFGLYAVADQMIWRGAEKERTLNLFVRPMAAPQGDRNLTTFSIDAGLTLHDPLPGRKDDTFGLGFGFVQLSPGAIGYSRDAAFYNPGVYSPILSNETLVEATYQIQATPWAQIQPDLQFVHNPGGGVANPNTGGKTGDALVAGLRVNLTF
jgi:porin